jgi:hypothetical protein
MWKRQIRRAYVGEPGLVLFSSPRMTRKQRREISRLVRGLNKMLKENPPWHGLGS